MLPWLPLCSGLSVSCWGVIDLKRFLLWLPVLLLVFSLPVAAAEDSGLTSESDSVSVLSSAGVDPSGSESISAENSIVSSENASESEVVSEEEKPFFDKPFNEYSTVEGLLFILVVLGCVSLVVSILWR